MTAADHHPSEEALRRALVALKDLKARVERYEQAASAPIAIVGAGCRFPGGASSLEAYWELLRAGRDGIVSVPATRWDHDRYYDADPERVGTIYTDRGGFLAEPVDEFDAAFFGIAPVEARGLDPQQRLLLEVTWEALEHAAIAPDSLAGSATGVFIGLGTADYSNLQLRGGDPATISRYYGTGSGLSVAAGRIAYVLGLRGPTIALDTACSSSLVATAQAMQALRADTCRMAVVGGVNLMLDPLPLIFLSQFRALSPTGRCHTFGAGADGYVRAEGCGVVILKRLADAQADGDRVLAVLRAAAVNHDGRSSGLTVPSGIAQREVLERALADARLEPTDIDLVEAHGTGTALGDPIEVRAIDAVYSRGRPAERPLLISSAKTNVGHLEAAAGVAGLLKVVLALQHGEIPPHLLDGELSPHIDWASMPVTVAREGQPWPASDAPRRAAVSGFGLSGTNCHVIVEEAPAPAPRPAESPRPVVLTLSARDDVALVELVQQTAKVLPRYDRAPDVAWTSQVGRAQLPHRLAVTASSVPEAVALLDGWTPGATGAGASHAVVAPAPPALAFLFTGQGAQRPGMGRDLYEHEPAFRAVMDECDRGLRPHLAVPLLDVLYGGDPAVEALVHRTEYTQPAMFAFQCALAAVWRARGVVPAAVVGHSIGEFAAAVVAGVMDLETGVELTAVRGRLMGGLPEGGAMVAVFADEGRVRRLVEPFRHEVAVAATNGPGHVVLSGAAPAVETILAGLRDGVTHRSLRVSHAFHSPLMAPMVADFAAHTERASYRPPTVPFISSVTGAAETESPATAAYWRDQILATVQFGAAVEALRTAGIDQVLEIGPQATLLGLVARVDGALGLHASLRPAGARDERTQLADATGSLWAAGVAVDWRAVAAAPAAKVDLPTYPFQRQRYWLSDATTAALGGAAPAVPAADQCVYEPQWVPLGAAAPASAPPGAWLVAGGSGHAVAAELRRRGQTVEVVADADAGAAVGTWAGVVLTAPAADGQPDDDAGPVAGQRRRLAPLLTLVQRMLAHEVGLADGGRLWLLTRNGQPVPGSPAPVDLTEAPLWGVANAITVEEPNLRVACIDVESVADAAALVVDELLDGGPEDRVALRGDARLGLRLAAAGPLAGPDPSSTRIGGAYLITGGLGALGLHAARTAAAAGATHLALLGRRAPSESAEQAITEIREAGVAVTVFAGDVADAELVEAVVADVRATMGPLRGVIHAAGVLDDGTLRNLDWPRFEAVLRPKVAGAWNLHRATLDDPLDVFVLYSSAAALLGASGQANYVAANAFLDALAHHRQAAGRPALSVNWGAWDEAGMAARLGDGQRSRLTRTGVALIDPALGDRLLGQLLATPAAQIGVIPVDWREVVRRSPAAMQRPFYGALVPAVMPGGPGGAAPPGGLIAELAALDADERVEHVRQHVRGAIVTVLGLEDVSALEAGLGLAELGMDSLMAVDLCNRLQWSTGVALESTVAFEWPTLDALSGHLAHDRLGIPSVSAALTAADRRAAAAEREAAERRAEIETISDLEAETSLLDVLERSGY